ncbi:MAG: hypothetical protein QW397_04290 [Fervidicoccaceae archaeon]
MSLYGGDKESAVIAFTLVFLKPLEKVLGAEDLSDHLLELVKTGRDREFIEAIAKALSSSKTAESNLLFTLEVHLFVEGLEPTIATYTLSPQREYIPFTSSLELLVSHNVIIN